MKKSKKKRLERKKKVAVGITKKVKAKEKKTYLNSKQLSSFKQLLLNRKELISNNIEEIEKSSLSKSQMESSGNISALPSHIADLGSDSYEQDFNISLVESSKNELEEINEALDRIVAKTYGLCEKCLNNIPIERLKAIPYARNCVKCQEEEES